MTDSQAVLSKVHKNGFGMSGCQAKTPPIYSLVWIYCPGHTGVQGNERADRLTSRTQVSETIMVNKGDIFKTIYER